MSITHYKPAPTSNDLLTHLIAKQAALKYQVIAQSANNVQNIENPATASGSRIRTPNSGE
jgi:hypothetical protein